MGSIEIKVANQPQGLPGEVTEAVALTGVATAQQPANLSNLAYANQVTSNNLSAQNQVARQDAMNRLHYSILAQAVNQVQDLQPVTARSSVAAFTDNETAQALADLRAVIGSFSGR
ncbi:hypothetical protein [Paracidovorax anthurii]|uniref:Killing trait domain-containing protein n=1 Tax=Paracidovorax anthurii TaxID=78229 RepID=A0A328YZ93_9BURK|nr:hypothetical protein [Paracidovorax anthurii]RAR77542.1 hypothetical protein AX018_103622 [Paracidovorax anthurii]WCM92833.1 hypothetical protein M5C99_21225 [Acidovorax sp. NCPPB 2350]